jgi:hypothetical protein
MGYIKKAYLMFSDPLSLYYLSAFSILKIKILARHSIWKCNFPQQLPASGNRIHFDLALIRVINMTECNQGEEICTGFRFKLLISYCNSFQGKEICIKNCLHSLESNMNTKIANSNIDGGFHKLSQWISIFVN